MQLRLSVLARNRAFSKAMGRVRVKLQPLLDDFAATEMVHPIYDAILVGITDEKGPDFFEVVETNDEFFQVLAGCGHRNTDKDVAADVLKILQRALQLCPFATPDRRIFAELFAKFEAELP
jgi:hypothetical protein